MSNDKYKAGLFIFRRDFRIEDNTTLLALQNVCEKIYPIFIFTPEQVSDKNKYKSENAVQFMIECLDDLNQEIKHLYSFYGENNEVLHYLIKKLSIDVIAFNYDYSPYALKRDEGIHKLCEKENISLLCEHDYYLQVPGSLLNNSNEPYKKFTPFYTKFMSTKFMSAKKVRTNKKFASILNFENLLFRMPLKLANHKFTTDNPHLLAYGGRKEALEKLHKAGLTQKKYAKEHDTLSMPTSELSAYIKFGCLSIREVYHYFKERNNDRLIRQLVWREFYANILFHYPSVLGHSLKPNYDKLQWVNNAKQIAAWKKGKTGFPVVDAGMRQLNKTGYMHNRARLITASFLVKTLLVDWRIGEQYFASQLIDYDPASNNGNWQWISGGGADSQPYFRIFNPWEQAKNHDSDCEYITKWIPELSSVPNKSILKWDTEYVNYPKIDYYEPIVNYNEQKKKVLSMYKRIY
jgi:deoxyribodipyrimidine photo-lyase